MNFRNLFSGLHVSVQVLLGLLIVILSYAVGRAYHWRFDLSEGRVYSLAPETVQVLRELQSVPIRVLAFFADEQPSRHELSNLLVEYAFQHPNFHFEFYDPDRAPAKAKMYQVDAYGTLVVEAGGERQSTKQVSEEAITNLLVKLWKRERKVIRFATGHGEPSVRETAQKTGYGLFRQALLDANYEVKETVLLREGAGEDTALLVLAGPQIDLTSQEREILRAFLNEGGNLLMLVDPVKPGEGGNIKEFLLTYGVELGDNVVVDKVSKLFGADYLVPLVTDYRPHEITGGFRVATLFPIVRSVRKAVTRAGNLEVVEIAWTGPGSWAETNLKDLEDGSAEFQKGEDGASPVPILVAVSRKDGKGRQVISGDSGFVTNGYLGVAGNKDLALNLVAWLTHDETRLTIRPRSREATPLFLKQEDQTFLLYGTVFGLPAFFLATGTGVFIFRRRYH